MKKNNLSVLNIILTSIFIVCLVSCKNANTETPAPPIEIEPILDGQYTVEFEYSDVSEREDIWIFKDHFMFVISPEDKTRVKSSFPVRFFVKEKELFICGVRGIWDPETIKECDDSDAFPSFEIMKIDTIPDKYFEEDKYQRITLMNRMGSMETVTIKKVLPR